MLLFSRVGSVSLATQTPSLVSLFFTEERTDEIRCISYIRLYVLFNTWPVCSSVKYTVYGIRVCVYAQSRMCAHVRTCTRTAAVSGEHVPGQQVGLALTREE